MPIFQLTETLSVAAQVTPQDIPNIAAQGFSTVVCNRPDGEVPDQASMDAIEAACNDANVLFVRYPVDALNFPGPDLEGLGELFDDAGQRVLAYCRTGTRCANLWVATRSEEERQAAIQVAREIGFDLSMVTPR
ncbi:MAG: TIGR01244 family sulfur transferase [Proteobacteria bacterium]|nr:TIGR01244 family phosphatase [Luminiphilus sp.]MBL6820431.1 TIGR01244 family phosphatase [Luminiphilus sp.]MDA0649964.1 TIGR01244 family sulfur transferase [Pseudomonadota bacterium]